MNAVANTGGMPASPAKADDGDGPVRQFWTDMDWENDNPG